MTCTISRIYGKIIKYFVGKEFNHFEIEEQAGFRPGISTMDHVFCLQQLIEKKKARGRPLHLLFLDLQKAYDSVPWKKLWQTLKSFNFNTVIISAIQNLYSDSISKIKIGKHLSHGFKVSKGLRQGCSLSPTLFKIYSRSIIRGRIGNIETL